MANAVVIILVIGGRRIEIRISMGMVVACLRLLM